MTASKGDRPFCEFIKGGVVFGFYTVAPAGGTQETFPTVIEKYCCRTMMVFPKALF